MAQDLLAAVPLTPAGRTIRLAQAVRKRMAAAPPRTSIQVSPAPHIDVRPFVTGEAAAVFCYL